MKFKPYLNFKIIREDFRKLGLAFIGGGFIGIVVKIDKVTFAEGAIVSIFGFILWISSVIYTPSDSEKEDS